MKLANLEIDRFGDGLKWSLRALSHDLNVIYGPTAAETTSIVELVRWILFGHAGHASLPMTISGGVPFRASATIREGSETRDYTCTHPLYGANEVAYDGSSEPVAPPPVGVSISEYDRFFSIRLDRPHPLADLLRVASVHGFQLDHRARDFERIQQLTGQIERCRDELRSIPVVEASPQSLRWRRDEKQRALETVRRDGRRYRDELQRRQQQLAAEVSDRRALIERLEALVQKTDEAITTRREQLREGRQERIASQKKESDLQRGRLAELEGEMGSWREILDEVCKRRDHLHSRIESIQKGSDPLPNATEIRCFLRSCDLRIQDLEHDLGGPYDFDAWRDEGTSASGLNPSVGLVFEALRDDISWLHHTIERQRRAVELDEYRQELKYLRRCEFELSDLLGALDRRREKLARDLSRRHDDGLAAGADERAADPQFAIGPDAVEAQYDFRLRYLVARRDTVASRRDHVTVELADRQRRLRDIEGELSCLVDDHRPVDLQREIDAMDTMLRQADERRSLERTILWLEDECRRLRAGLGKSEILDEAAAILSRLTSHEFTSVDVTEIGNCRVRRRDGRVYDETQLGRGVHDQLYLSLCLAIARGYRRRQIEVPVILHDIFGNLDPLAARQLAEFLAEFSRDGQQVLVLTRNESILNLFRQQAARCFSLESGEVLERKFQLAGVAAMPVPHSASRTPFESPEAAAPPLASELPPPALAEPTYRRDADGHRQPVPPAPASPAGPPPVRPPAPGDAEPPSGQLGLQLTSSLEEVPFLEMTIVGLMHAIGIDTVDAFLELDPERVESQLGSEGITAEILQRRQREILMVLYVAVAPREAQLLVACGVPDPERLARADEEVLLRRVETLLRRPEAASHFGTVEQYPARRIRRWIETAQASTNGQPPSAAPSKPFAAGDESRPGARLAADVTTSRSKTAPRGDTVRLRPARELRFYLNPGDPVIDAPSIGPKTAERLHGVDVRSVGDLLEADADEVATRLNERRITRETIVQWQLQARLVCRIPNLRSHEAQILVACGVEDPAELATLDASSLLQQVTKFVKTKEGQRILRNAKRPDLAEVTAWIEWSENARHLKAA